MPNQRAAGQRRPANRAKRNRRSGVGWRPVHKPSVGINAACATWASRVGKLCESPTLAIPHTTRSESDRHMARTPAVQQALSHAWLKAQGLVSVKDLWCKVQGCTN